MNSHALKAELIARVAHHCEGEDCEVCSVSHYAEVLEETTPRPDHCLLDRETINRLVGQFGPDLDLSSDLRRAKFEELAWLMVEQERTQALIYSKASSEIEDSGLLTVWTDLHSRIQLVLEDLDLSPSPKVATGVFSN